ncbi:MAG: hypothetical protein KDJ52_10375 [Anaerolineae bacterium]|nr:hypothetical protein [Anaerolineae bacterium]
MKGDVIIIEDYHYTAALEIVDYLLPKIQAKQGRYTITVAGESGSGKSEMGQAIATVLNYKEILAGVFQQDDYFIYPPKTNHNTRLKDISWVGPQEVKLALLDEHLKAAWDGEEEVVKPLVIFAEDRIEEETMTLKGLNVLIAEGTYTSLLENVDARVFLTRNRLETMESRRKRGREPMDPFFEEVLEIEHDIISKHKARADVIVNNEFQVEFVDAMAAPA